MSRKSEVILESVMKEYIRPIVHIRQEIEKKRFGIIFGAGASKALQFPDWDELLKRIALNRKVGGKWLLDKGKRNISRSQLLFQHYRKKQLDKANKQDFQYNRFEIKIKAEWLKIVRDALYNDVPKTTLYR